MLEGGEVVAREEGGREMDCSVLRVEARVLIVDLICSSRAVEVARRVRIRL